MVKSFKVLNIYIIKVIWSLSGLRSSRIQPPTKVVVFAHRSSFTHDAFYSSTFMSSGVGACPHRAYKC